MQSDRLFEIVYILMEKETVTAKWLAERFEVSTRTIYRDIDLLSRSGIPVYAQRGRNGGISIMPGFVLSKSFLSSDEQNEILSALQALDATQYPGAQRTLEKLSVFFGTMPHSWIEVDFSDWSENAQTLFAHIKTAIISKKCIDFEYYGSRGDKTARRVEPLQLWYKERRWFLRAYCLKRSAARIFKLSRIKNCTLTDISFDRVFCENDFILDFENAAQYRIPVTLKITPDMSFRVFDEFDPEEITTHADGSFTVTVNYIPDQWLIGYILSFGHHAQVLAPTSIRDTVRQQIKDLENIYSTS